jgi:hypothetical protein
VSFSTQEIEFRHAFAIERAIRCWLASLGRAVIPCTDFCGRSEKDRGAPMIYTLHGKRPDKIILPDFISFLPTIQALEIKTQGYAPWFAKASTYTTGVQDRQLDSYQRFEQTTHVPVSIAFVHLVEWEIRGGTLAEMAPARTPRVNYMPGTTLWEYERLPRWTQRLDELLAVATEVAPHLGRSGYTKEDHAAVLAYRDNVAVPNARRHMDKFGSRPPPPVVVQLPPLPKPKPKPQRGLFDPPDDEAA